MTKNEFTEAVIRRCSSKLGVLKTFPYFPRKHVLESLSDLQLY